MNDEPTLSDSLWRVEEIIAPPNVVVATYKVRLAHPWLQIEPEDGDLHPGVKA